MTDAPPPGRRLRLRRSRGLRRRSAPRRPRKVFLVRGPGPGGRSGHRAVHQRGHEPELVGRRLRRAGRCRRSRPPTSDRRPEQGGGPGRRRGRRHAGRAPVLRLVVLELPGRAPPLTATVRKQDAARGALSRIHVIGVDTLDSPSNARSFIAKEGVTFPVASTRTPPSRRRPSTSRATPTRCSCAATGRSPRSCRARCSTPASFTADERGRSFPAERERGGHGRRHRPDGRARPRTPHGTAAPLPSVACSAAERAAAGRSLAKSASPLGQLGHRDHHARRAGGGRGRGRWPRPGSPRPAGCRP